MLSQRMRRTLTLLIVLVVAMIALEPVVHTHPLTQNASSTQCALCVNAHARVTTLKPAAISPLVAVGDVACLRQTADALLLQTRLASRAPPAA